MLSTQTIETVKSTVPLLEEKGLQITSHFYQRLFETAPELKNVFNSANQRDDSQSSALADAVLAYAANIDNLEALLPAVARIANKHASLGVLPEHYSVVGSCLLQSIQTVAELPDNHPALGAWGEAYGVLADVFIASEDKLYTDSETQTGGWKGFRQFTIEQIKPETPEVSSFVLSPADGLHLINFAAGQYLSVKIPGLADGFDQIRQYSLSEWSENPQQYRLSVKKESHGQVSTNLHQFQVGDTLLVSPPYGQFLLNTEATEQVFISGGVGITPLFAMLQQASQLDKSVPLTFITCSRNAEHQIFGEQLNALVNENNVTLKSALEVGSTGDYSGRLTTEILTEWLPNTTADVYFCGPLPFMKSLKKILNEVGFTDDKLHYEVFGPTTSL